MKIRIWLVAISFLIPYIAISQDVNSIDSSYRTKPKITPFLVPSYSPEVKLIIVAGGIFTFQTGTDLDTKRSSIPFNVGWSTNNSKEIDFRPVIYGRNNNIRFFGRMVLKDMPDHYYGVGYFNARDTKTSDSTTLYHRFWWQTDLNFVRRVRGPLFAGIRFDFNRTKATELNEQMVMDERTIEEGTDIQNSGVGFIIQYDTRDFEVNSKSGLLLNLSSTFYGKLFNSRFNYNLLVLEYRQFKTVSPGRVLAWTIKINNGSGNVPWTELPKLGTAFDLRGYRNGRYRDKSAGFGIVEYRHTFRKSKSAEGAPRLSKHGLVVWAGTGSLAESMDKWNQWLPNYGLGYRFEVQPSINARLDFGFGLQSTGFYINFNEAF